jgi:hypothetical protein
MGFSTYLPRLLGEFRKLSVTMAAVAILSGLNVTGVRAGEVANSADSLNVTGATAGMLPQAGGATESSLLSGLHISGYASQLFGMYQDPPALRDFTPSRNNLSTSRTLLQVDENYELGDSNNFFAREWFVYEPPYSFNSANNGPCTQFFNLVSKCEGNYPHGSWSADSPNHSSYGHFMNGYYNNYQVRDAWWENKTGPLTTYVGNQIVVWGQSVAFRVGDVVNPTDTCWAFGFANLEQSRVPQWMIHPILNLPEAGPFESNFVEAIIEPGWSPNYWPEQQDDPYGKYIGEGSKAARVQPCFPSASHGPSARFDIHYTNSPVFGLSYWTGSGAPSANPFGIEGWRCGTGSTTNFSASVAKGWNPLPPGWRNFACRNGLSKGNNPYSPIGDGTALDVGVWNIPGMQPQNWNDGVRLHTLLGQTELTWLYYNDSVSGGVPWGARWTPQTNLFNYTFYDIQETGVTADRPLPIPASLAEYFPAVFRGEVLYQNHVNFADMAVTDWQGDAYSDQVKWMAAIDVDQAYAPWLTSTGNLTANFEFYDNIIMDERKTFTVGNAVDRNPAKNDVSVLASIGTSWLWSDIAPNYTMIFQPKGRNMAIFPSITFNPPWTKKYFMSLQAIEVLGGDSLSGVGLFKGESQLNATFQYNFNIM